MRDTELYKHLLGLTAPWTVSRVELDVKAQRVDVFAEHTKPKTWPCPECGAACGLHDHEEERVWRHLVGAHPRARKFGQADACGRLLGRFAGSGEPEVAWCGGAKSEGPE